MTDRHQLWALLDRVQMDVRALDTKIQSIRTHVAALELPDQPHPIRCPQCAATHRSRTQHEEHIYRIHNGPVPTSDLAAERAAGLDITPILGEMLNEIGAAQDTRLATQLVAEANAALTRIELDRASSPTCTCGWPDRDCVIRAIGSKPEDNEHLDCGERDAPSVSPVACAHTSVPEDA